MFDPASSHWYLVVICFAGQEDPVYVNEINDEDDDETGTKVHFAVDKLKILKLYTSYYFWTVGNLKTVVY